MIETKKNLDHPLVIGKSTKNGEEGEGYTIFKNTNKELVAKIKALNKTSETWKENRYKGLCKVAKELNDTQRLCIDEAGEYFIKKVSDFSNTSKDNLLDEINEKFDVSEHIVELLGPLYTEDGYKKIVFKSYKDQLKQYEGHPNFNNVKHMFNSWSSMGRISSEEVGAYLDTYRGIVLSEGDCGGSSMFCHFNVDGNISNRDYNYDLKYFLGNKPKTREDLIEEIIANIPDVPYKNYGNKWFSDKFAFVLENTSPHDIHEEVGGTERGNIVFKLNKLEHIHGDNYGDRHSGKIKMPKATTPATREDILLLILPLVNSMKVFGESVDLSKYIDVSKLDAKSISKPIVKRLQKTKLDEKKFSEVYDYSKKGDDCYEDVIADKKLMKALSNLENGIKVGDSEDIIKEVVIDILKNGDLPSFSFNKGEKQPNHDKYKGLVKLPHGCNFTFKVEEGSAEEITWAHSIYSTEVVEFELVP